MALAASCSVRAGQTAETPAPCGKVRFRLGMAGYTYHKFKLDETLEALERFGVHDLCVKDFHLPLTATAEEIATFRAKCADHGVTPYGVGPIYMQGEDEAKRAFDYAAALGVDVDSLLVSQPDTGEDALEIAEALIRSGAIDVIVIDSVAALVPRSEIEAEMGDSVVGLQARLMSQALRKLTGDYRICFWLFSAIMIVVIVVFQFVLRTARKDKEMILALETA